MDEQKVDPSLAEVRRWRSEAQEELSRLGPEAEAEELNRRGEEIIRRYHLTTEPRRS